MKNSSLLKELASDMEICETNLANSDTQFWRRTSIRTVAACIEALNESMRELAIQASCSGKQTYNLSKIELLKGRSYRILKNGKIEGDDLRAPLVNYTAFLFRVLAEESGREATFFSDHRWSLFQKFIDCRNRLTHPKDESDLIVNDEDIAAMHESLVWYMESFDHSTSNRDFWQIVDGSEH